MKNYNKILTMMMVINWLWEWYRRLDELQQFVSNVYIKESTDFNILEA